jgi:hypothetical protein
LSEDGVGKESAPTFETTAKVVRVAREINSGQAAIDPRTFFGRSKLPPNGFPFLRSGRRQAPAQRVSAPAQRQGSAGSLEVFGGVDAEGAVGGDDDLDAMSVFEGAELLEVFGELEWSPGELGIAEEEVAAESVEAEMKIGGGGPLAGLAEVGDGGAGEIEGIAVVVEDDLDCGRVLVFFFGANGCGESRHFEVRVFEERGRHLVNHVGMKERLVSLDVDDDFGFEAAGDLRDAVGAGGAVGAGHDGLAAEGLDGAADAVIIGGDDDGGGAFGSGGALPDVLDHGFAGDVGEGLGGEAGGGIAGGDDDGDTARRLICPGLGAHFR